MAFWQEKTKYPWLRLVAFVVLILFTVTTLAWADGTNVIADSIHRDVQAISAKQRSGSAANFGGPFSDYLTDISRIKIPNEIGTIKSAFQGAQDRLVIHVQDAHVNEEAQRNISRIIQYFHETAKNRYVAIEGASGDLDTALFAAFPNLKSRTLVADYYLKQGTITGPQHLALTTLPELKIFGAEENELYDENRAAFLEALEFKDRSVKALDEIRLRLDQISRFVFSSDLKRLRDEHEGFKNQKSYLNHYVKYLTESAERLNVSRYPYRQVQSFLDLVELEKIIDFKTAEAEIDQLISDLKKILTREELSEFVTNSIQFRIKKMTRAEYYGYLEEKVSAHSEADQYRNVIHYLKYTKSYDSIGVELFDEIEQLELAIKNKLFRNDSEVKLDRLYQFLAILDNIFDFLLTKKDVDYFYTYRDEFKAETFRSFIESESGKANQTLTLSESIDVIDQDLPRIERFYKAALKRDHVLIEKTYEKMVSTNEKVSVIVTGGFHTAGIERYLKEKDISYLVIAPRMVKAIDEVKESKLYEQAMRNVPTRLESILNEIYFPPKSAALNDPRYQLGVQADIYVPAENGNTIEKINRMPSLASVALERLTPESVESFRSEVRQNYGEINGVTDLSNIDRFLEILFKPMSVDADGHIYLDRETGYSQYLAISVTPENPDTKLRSPLSQAGKLIQSMPMEDRDDPTKSVTIDVYAVPSHVASHATPLISDISHVQVQSQVAAVEVSPEAKKVETTSPINRRANVIREQIIAVDIHNRKTAFRDLGLIRNRIKMLRESNKVLTSEEKTTLQDLEQFFDGRISEAMGVWIVKITDQAKNLTREDSKYSIEARRKDANSLSRSLRNFRNQVTASEFDGRTQQAETYIFEARKEWNRVKKVEREQARNRKVEQKAKDVAIEKVVAETPVIKVALPTKKAPLVPHVTNLKSKATTVSSHLPKSSLEVWMSSIVGLASQVTTKMVSNFKTTLSAKRTRKKEKIHKIEKLEDRFAFAGIQAEMISDPLPQSDTNGFVESAIIFSLDNPEFELPQTIIEIEPLPNIVFEEGKPVISGPIIIADPNNNFDIEPVSQTTFNLVDGTTGEKFSVTLTREGDTLDEAVIILRDNPSEYSGHFGEIQLKNGHAYDFGLSSRENEKRKSWISIQTEPLPPAIGIIGNVGSTEILIRREDGTLRNVREPIIKQPLNVRDYYNRQPTGSPAPPLESYGEMRQRWSSEMQASGTPIQEPAGYTELEFTYQYKTLADPTTGLDVLRIELVQLKEENFKKYQLVVRDAEGKELSRIDLPNQAMEIEKIVYVKLQKNGNYEVAFYLKDSNGELHFVSFGFDPKEKIVILPENIDEAIRQAVAEPQAQISVDDEMVEAFLKMKETSPQVQEDAFEALYLETTPQGQFDKMLDEGGEKAIAEVSAPAKRSEARIGLPDRRTALKALGGGVVAAQLSGPVEIGFTQVVSAVTPQTSSDPIESLLKALGQSPQEFRNQVIQATSIEPAKEKLNHVGSDKFKELSQNQKHLPQLKQTAQRVFINLLKLNQGKHDSFTAEDWTVFLLHRDMARFDMIGGNLKDPRTGEAVQTDELFLSKFEEAAREAIEWLNFNKRMTTQDLKKSVDRMAALSPNRYSQAELNSIYNWLETNMGQMTNIERDEELPDMFRNFTEAVHSSDWVTLNQNWVKSDLGKSIGINLDSLVGLIIRFAKIKYDHEINQMIKIESPSEALAWYQPQHFFSDIYLILNRGKINHSGAYDITTTLRTHMKGRVSNFLNYTDVNLKERMRKESIEGDRTERLDDLFPHWQNKNLRQFTNPNPQVITPAIVTTYYSWGVLGEMKEELDGTVQMTSEDIISPEGFDILTAGTDALYALETDPLDRLNRLYQNQNDPVLQDIFARWKLGQFSGDLEDPEKFIPRITVSDIKKIDLTRLNSDGRELVTSLIRILELNPNNKYLSREAHIDIIELAVGINLGRLMAWERYGLEEGLIQVYRKPDGSFIINMSDLGDQLTDMAKILPFVEMFFGRRFNLNQNSDIGTISGMWQALKHMKLSPEQFRTLLLLASDKNGINQVLVGTKENPGYLRHPNVSDSEKTELMRLIRNIKRSEYQFPIQRQSEQLLAALSSIKKLDFSDPVTGAQQIGFVMSQVMEMVRTGSNGYVEKIEAILDLIKKIGRDPVFKETENFFQSFGHEMSAQLPHVQGDFLEMSAKAQGQVMASLNGSLQEGQGMKGWENLLAKRKIILDYFKRHGYSQNKNNRRSQDLIQAATDFRDIRKDLTQFGGTNDPEVLRRLVVESSKVQGAFISWLVKQAETEEKNLRTTQLSRSEVRINPSGLIHRRAVLKAALGGVVGIASAGIPSETVNAQQSVLPEQFAQSSTTFPTNPYMAPLTNGNFSSDSFSQLSMLQVPQAIFPSRPIGLSGATNTTTQYWSDDLTPIWTDTKPGGKRETVLKEAQALVDFWYGEKQVIVQDENFEKDPRAEGAFNGISEFRIGLPIGAEESWVRTENVILETITILTRLDHASQDGGVNNFGVNFFNRAAQLYFLDEGYTIDQARVAAQNVTGLQFFKDNKRAGDFLTGYAAMLVIDFKEGLSTGKEIAIGDRLSPQNFAKHTENLLFVLTNPEFRTHLETYYQGINRQDVKLNPFHADSTIRRQVWGEYAVRLKMIEEVFGTYDLNADQILDTMKELVRVQKAGNDAWRKLEDGEIYYYYRLFYTTTAKEEFTANPDRQVGRIPYSNMKGNPTIEEFFNLVAFAQKTRIRAADGDLQVQTVEDGINMKFGILKALNMWESVLNGTQKPVKGEEPPKWMTLKDIQMIRELVGSRTDEDNRRKLRNAPIGDGEAVQMVTHFLDDRGDFNGGEWPGLEPSKGQMLRTARLEMFLQAAYMLYHKDANGIQKRLGLADLSSWVTNIRKGHFDYLDVGGYLRDDGVFEQAEQFNHQFGEKVIKLLQDVEQELGSEAVSNFPIFDDWMRQGFIVRMHQLGDYDEWLGNWFADVFKIQVAYYRNMGGRFIDPSIISYTVQQFREWKPKIADPTERRMIKYLQSVAHNDLSYMDLGIEGNELRRLMLTWQSIFNRLPTDAEIESILRDWKNLYSANYLSTRPIREREAAQRQLIARRRMIQDSSISVVANSIYVLDSNASISEQLSPALNQIQSLITDRLLALMHREPARTQKQHDLRNAKMLETENLDPIRNRIKARRKKDIEDGKVPGGKNGHSKESVMNELKIKYTQYMANQTSKHKTDYSKEISHGVLEAYIGRMIERGYTTDEAFMRFVELENQAADIYLETYNISSRLQLNSSQRAFISALAERLFNDWGIIEEKNQKEFMVKSITQELERLKEVIKMSQRIRDVLKRELNIEMSEEKSFEWADNSYNSAVLIEEIEAWIIKSKQTHAALNKIVVNGTSINISLDDVLYLVDSWLKIGLAKSIKELKQTTSSVQVAVNKELARIQVQDVDGKIAERMALRGVSPAQLKILVDQVILLRAEYEAEIDRDKQKSVVSDPTKTPRGTYDLIKQLTDLDLLVYLDDLTTHPAMHIGILELPELGYTREKVESNIALPINAMFRLKMIDELKKRLPEDIWKKNWSKLDKMRTDLYEDHGIGNGTLIGGIAIFGTILSLAIGWLYNRYITVTTRRPPPYTVGTARPGTHLAERAHPPKPSNRMWLFRIGATFLTMIPTAAFLVSLDWSFYSPMAIILLTATFIILISPITSFYLWLLMFWMYAKLTGQAQQPEDPTANNPDGTIANGHMLQLIGLAPLRTGNHNDYTVYDVVLNDAIEILSQRDDPNLIYTLVIQFPPAGAPNEKEMKSRRDYAADRRNKLIAEAIERKVKEKQINLNERDLFIESVRSRLFIAVRYTGIPKPETYYNAGGLRWLYEAGPLIDPFLPNAHDLVKESEYTQATSYVPSNASFDQYKEQGVRTNVDPYVPLNGIDFPEKDGYAMPLSEIIGGPETPAGKLKYRHLIDLREETIRNRDLYIRPLEERARELRDRTEALAEQILAQKLNQKRSEVRIGSKKTLEEQAFEEAYQQLKPEWDQLHQDGKDVLAKLKRGEIFISPIRSSQVIDAGIKTSHENMATLARVLSGIPGIAAQGRIIYRDAYKTLYSLLMKSFPQEILWPTQEAMQFVFGKIRAFGKYAFNNDLFYLKIVRPWVDDYGNLLRKRYTVPGFKKAPLSEDEFTAGELENEDEGMVLAPQVILYEDPMYNFLQEYLRMKSKWTATFDVGSIMISRLLPSIKDRPILTSVSIGLFIGIYLSNFILPLIGLILPAWLSSLFPAVLVFSLAHAIVWGVTISLVAALFLTMSVKLRFYESQGQIDFAELGPAARLQNNLVIRGNFSEMIWATQLIIMFVGMINPGLIGVSYPFLGEGIFLVIMVLLAHPKILLSAYSIIQSIYTKTNEDFKALDRWANGDKEDNVKTVDNKEDNIQKDNPEENETRAEARVRKGNKFKKAVAFVLKGFIILQYISYGVVEFVLSTSIYLLFVIQKPLVVIISFIRYTFAILYGIDVLKKDTKEKPNLIDRMLIRIWKILEWGTHPTSLAWIVAGISEKNAPFFLYYWTMKLVFTFGLMTFLLLSIPHLGPTFGFYVIFSVISWLMVYGLRGHFMLSRDHDEYVTSGNLIEGFVAIGLLVYFWLQLPTLYTLFPLDLLKRASPIFITAFLFGPATAWLAGANISQVKDDTGKVIGGWSNEEKDRFFLLTRAVAFGLFSIAITGMLIFSFPSLSKFIGDYVGFFTSMMITGDGGFSVPPVILNFSENLRTIPLFALFFNLILGGGLAIGVTAFILGFTSEVWNWLKSIIKTVPNAILSSNNKSRFRWFIVSIGAAGALSIIYFVMKPERHNNSMFLDPSSVKAEKDLTPKINRSEVRTSFDHQLKTLWQERMDQGNVFLYNLDSILDKQLGRFNIQTNPGRIDREKQVNRPRQDNNAVFTHFGSTIDFNAIYQKHPDQKLMDRVIGGESVTFGINYAPLVKHHFLLIPYINENAPQFITERALNVVLGVLKQSESNDLLFGFNSLGTWASINHLHFQGVYFSEGSQPIEQATKDEVADFGNGVKAFQLKDYPLNGLFFSIPHDNPIQAVKPLVSFISMLQTNNIPHVLLIRKNGAYIVPYSRYEHPEFTPAGFAFMETLGRINILPEYYGILSEEEVRDALSKATLESSSFNQLVEDYVSTQSRSEVRHADQRGPFQSAPRAAARAEVRSKSSRPAVGIIGLNQMGIQLSKYYADLTDKVYVYDENAKNVGKWGKNIQDDPNYRSRFSNDLVGHTGPQLEDVVRQSDLIVVNFYPLDRESPIEYQTRLFKLFSELNKSMRKIKDGRFRTIIVRSVIPFLASREGVPFTQFIHNMLGQGNSGEFEVIFQPSFVQRDPTLEDLKNERVVLGTLGGRKDTAGVTVLKEVLGSESSKVETASVRSVELTQFFLPIYLAKKLSHRNQLTPLFNLLNQEGVGGDLNATSLIAGADKRVNTDYYHVSPGIGGWLLTIIQSVLARLREEQEGKPNIIVERLIDMLEAILKANEAQLTSLKELIAMDEPSLEGKTVGLLGVSNRPGSGRVQDSPSLELIKWFVGHGVKKILIYDPYAETHFNKWRRNLLKEHPIFASVEIQFVSAEEALQDAHFAVVGTAHPEITNLSPESIAEHLGQRTLYDGSNIYGLQPDGSQRYSLMQVEEAGLNYVSLGRRQVGPNAPAPLTFESHVIRSSAEIPQANDPRKRVGVVGTGYVGLVSAAEFAELGHRVTGVDLLQAKIDKLNRGERVIYEPGLDELLAKHKDKNIFFTTDMEKMVQENEIIFLAVGTPSASTGAIDLGYIQGAARDIGKAILKLKETAGVRGPPERKTIVIKSTVTPDAFLRISEVMKELGLELGVDYALASNPEFLREGSAIFDVQNPDRIALGIDTRMNATAIKETAETLLQLYRPRIESLETRLAQGETVPAPFVIVTDAVSAPLGKYLANTHLASDIKFSDISSRYAKSLGASWNEITNMMRRDLRISPYWFREPGCGYGGSCFPKDVKALLAYIESYEMPATPLHLTVAVNEWVKKVDFVSLVVKAVQGGRQWTGISKQPLLGKRIGVWGLAFKEDTDDVRESPSLDIVPTLIELGATVVIHDPLHEAVENFERTLKSDEYLGTDKYEEYINNGKLIIAKDIYEPVEGSDALVLLTKWKEYLPKSGKNSEGVDFARVRRLMHKPIIVAGRPLYDASQMHKSGFSFYSVSEPDLVVRAEVRITDQATAFESSENFDRYIDLRIQELIHGYENQIEELLTKWAATSDANTRKEIEAQEIKPLLNEINAAAFKIRPDEVRVEQDKTEGSSEGIEILDRSGISETERLVTANEIIDGKISPEFIFAGAATRLGRGAIYFVNIPELALEKNIPIPSGVNPSIQMGQGPRQLIAYRMRLEEESKKTNKDVDTVLSKHLIIIHISESDTDEITKDMIDHRFYGFSNQNVFFVPQPTFHGRRVENGQVIKSSESKTFVSGHGYASAQLNQTNAFYLDHNGERIYLTEKILDRLKTNGSQMIISHRVNDLTQIGKEVLDLDRITFTRHLIKNEGSHVVTEAVENPNDQKGGNRVELIKPAPHMNNRFLLETITSGTPEWKSFFKANLNVPYNAFRNGYDVDAIGKAFSEEGLPNWLTFKEGYLYLESVTGDLTQNPNLKNVGFRIPGELIHDFKEEKNIGEGLEFVAIQDQNPRFVELAKEYGFHRSEAREIEYIDQFKNAVQGIQEQKSELLNQELQDLIRQGRGRDDEAVMNLDRAIQDAIAKQFRIPTVDGTYSGKRIVVTSWNDELTIADLFVMVGQLPKGGKLKIAVDPKERHAADLIFAKLPLEVQNQIEFKTTSLIEFAQEELAKVERRFAREMTIPLEYVDSAYSPSIVGAAGGLEYDLIVLVPEGVSTGLENMSIPRELLEGLIREWRDQFKAQEARARAA